MGPRVDLKLRRRREAPPDLAGEALQRPKTSGKKVHICCKHRVSPLFPL